MPLPFQALVWGLVSGSALVIGAAAAWFVHIPQRLTAAVMAFGSGILISALSFDLMDEAFKSGGFWSAASGLFAGAAVYTAANVALSRRGARHRKRSGNQQPKDTQGGVMIALGALLDGIPESMVIGVSLLHGEGVSLVAVIAIFLSNFPEGLSSAEGMKKAGRSPRYVFGIWSAIALASGIASFLGNIGFGDASPMTIAFVQAFAAGAILSMVADTLIPEAFEVTHDYAGLITAVGFLAAFALSKLASG